MHTQLPDKVSIPRAAILLKSTYNRLRRAVSLGELEGGYDTATGYFVTREAVHRALIAAGREDAGASPAQPGSGTASVQQSEG